MALRVDFNELVVLATIGGGETTKQELAADVVRRFGSPKDDAATVGKTIDGLVALRYLSSDPNSKRLALSISGHAAVLDAISTVEELRAALGMAYFNVVKRSAR